jgi:DNA-directed RNA polymerase specialized sigma24 family protein
VTNQDKAQQVMEFLPLYEAIASRLCRARNLNHILADVKQEAFLIALEAIDSFDGSRSTNLQGFMSVRVKQRLVDRLRQQKAIQRYRKVRFEPFSESHHGAEHMPDYDSSILLGQLIAMAKPPITDAEISSLRWCLEDREERMLTGRSSGAAKFLIHHAKQKIRNGITQAAAHSADPADRSSNEERETD